MVVASARAGDLALVRWLFEHGARLADLATDASGLGAVASAECYDLDAVEMSADVHAMRAELLRRGCRNERWPGARAPERKPRTVADFLIESLFPRFFFGPGG